jgi:heme exporter protein D
MTLSEFFHMGGYATFVWSSYALALVVLVLNWWLPLQQHKQNMKKLKRQYRSNKTQENKTHDPSS